MKIGFDNDKYLALQAEHIKERRSQCGDKRYLEFGGTLFAADALTPLIHELLLPLVYCHIALASAGAALPESGLDKLADGLKKLISWLLCGAVTAFTLYLSVSGVLTGSADRAAVKAAAKAKNEEKK